MDKVIIFVDAGYLYSGGVYNLYNKKIPRNCINLDIENFISYIKKELIKENEKLLRIYWYDGVLNTGLTHEQKDISLTENIKFRKGLVNEFNEQKGIDTQIIKDVFELSYFKSFSRGILFSSDGDLTVAADIAQKFGIQIDLLAIKNTNVSLELKQEVDQVYYLEQNYLSSIISVKDNIECLEENIEYDFLKKIIEQYLINIEEEDEELLFSTLNENNENIPYDIDKKLLAFSKKQLSRLLDISEKRILRHYLYKSVLELNKERFIHNVK